MSLERDIQSKNAIIEAEGITVSEVTTPVLSTTVIDTLGFRGLTVGIEPSRELDVVATEAFRFYAEDSPDGITYTHVDEIKILPTRNYDALGQLIINPVAPYFQTFGIISCERYVMVGAYSSVYNQSELGVAFAAALKAERTEFVGYEATPDAPHIDTQP